MRIKGPTANLQENTMITNIYATNIETLKPVKQTVTELKGEINSNPTIVGTLILYHQQWTDRPDRKSIKK